MPTVTIRPDWQRALIALSAVVVTTFIVTMLYWAQTVLIPIALAVFMSFVLSPPVSWLRRRGVPRTPAVIGVVGLASVLFAGVMVLMVSQVADLTRTLPDKADNIAAKPLKRSLPN